MEGILACKEYLLELKQLGLKAILIGYETFNDEELAKYNKKSTVSDNYKVAEMVKECGIDMWASFMAHPDWSKSDFNALRAAVKKLINNNTVMLKTFGGQNIFRILKGSIRAAWK